uniref:DNA repair protein SWI5 homolog n=1 Tax=Phallusia mammillata TaxID=59560 RepID=A0A6F9DUU5_9ASCI|nr:DNA repair protein SWI5 homolog [Phallusia mammillata]
MSQTPNTPVARNRTVSFLSSSKVRSAFKSPLRSPNTAGSPANTAASCNSSGRKRRRPALSGAFNSPLKLKSPKIEVTQEEIQSLKDLVKNQEKEIRELEEEGLREEDLQIHIDKLHEYNEIKDIGQLVIGRLAIQLQTTTRALYPKFNLNLED